MSSRRTLVYAACQLGGWGLYGLANILLSLLFIATTSRGGEQFASRTAWTVLMCISGGLITHLARTWLPLREWVRLPMRRLALLIPFTCTALGLVQQVIGLVLAYPVLHIYGASDFSFSFLIMGGAFWAVVMLMWLLTYLTVHFVEHAREVERERWRQEVAAQTSELRFLKAQLQPHFLFNCLNSVRALIVEDPVRAQQAVTRLSTLLRHALSSHGPETVPLSQELQVVRDYLSLEGIRLEERLRVREDVAPETLGIAVPAMLVQTLVENAIKHGIAQTPEGGEVAVLARVRDGALQLEVANTPAPAGTPAPPHSSGEGLHNASERLRLLCGMGASLQLDQTSAALTTARVRIPLSP
ncbi:sensor histidine kinase [Myxococcus landrumensis]|uniref:Histidine kinase n=1 Tax=Myxococcus landrumensis TaxID=2813577 RepID=A0ABX7MZ08_9BACT|nr:histidine kinase [Myxococcus landrumus]QSQ11583.1 histidine kinase [Myxococcus landrumus]